MTAFVDSSVATGRPAQVTIRELLRDTALVVTALEQGGTAEMIEALRERCQQLIVDFDAALERHNVAPDIGNDILHAQCGLLDEAVLRSLQPEKKHEWDRHPLQVERFNNHEAGEKVFDALDARMREPSPNVELLEAYSAILGLGFKGRYAREGEAKRVALMTSLDAQIAKLRPSVPRAFLADRSHTRLADRLHQLSPWAIAGIAGIVALVVYLAWNGVLNLQLAHLPPAKP
jgi:type VI secretion system protein ImpK